MALQSTGAVHLVHPPFHHLSHGPRLCVPSRDDDDLFRVHDSLHADCQGLSRDQLEIVVEETAVGQDGFLREDDGSGPGDERGAWLVERNMAVWCQTGVTEEPQSILARQLWKTKNEAMTGGPDHGHGRAGSK